MMGKSELKRLKCKMRRINLFFHPWRNNPRNVNMVYHTLIVMRGYDKWRMLDSEITSAWKSASNSFDEMYGLVRAWVESGILDVDDNNKKESDLTESREEAEIMETKKHFDYLSALRRQREILQAELEKTKVEVELMENRKRLNAIDGKNQTEISETDETNNAEV